MSELTEAKIEELRGLDAAATKGPWKWDGDVCDGSQDYRDQNAPWLVTDDNLEIPILRGDITGSRDADAALIVAMRNALPALLDLAASSLTRGGEGDGALDRIFSDPRLDRCRRHLSGSDIMIMIRHARETMWKPIASMPTGEDDFILARTEDGRVMQFRASILARNLKGPTPEHLSFPAIEWMASPIKR